METIRKRLEEELRGVVSRVRAMGGLDDMDELPASIESIFDDADKIQFDQAREMGLMTRARLMERVKKLSGALRRMDTGEYGTCVECGEAIKDARLRAMPEVATCVSCQEQIEQMARSQAAGARGPRDFWSE